MEEVTIKFPTKEHAQGFMYWLDGQGEQDYWIYSAENPSEVRTFNYNYEKQEIVGEE